MTGVTLYNGLPRSIVTFVTVHNKLPCSIMQVILLQHGCCTFVIILCVPFTRLFINCGEVEDVVDALTPVGTGVAQVFHDLLVELRLLLVAEVEEGEKEDRQEEGWEVESGVQGEEVAHMDGMWMTVSGVRARLELEPM